jgi:tetratricopeptide (TPR) repeat protein
VRHWLANSADSWLLIIDNADDPDFDYSRYFPAGAKGCIILTSRFPDCLDYGNVGSEEINGLADDDAVQLLLKSCGIGEDAWHMNRSDAQRIVDTLGRHTLAIIQAGAFIRKGLCNLKEYTDKFQQRRQDLLKYHPRQAQSTYKNVYATFDVSATFLQESGQGKDLRALQLLNVLGFMHLEQVPESIFSRAALYMNVVADNRRTGEDFAELYSWHLDRVPSDIMPKVVPGGLDMFAFREARAVLSSLSLVKVIGSESNMSMHPLVHAWIRDRILGGRDRYSIAWERAAVILALSTEESVSYQKFFPSLNVHIAACLDICPIGIISASPINIGYGHLFYRLGYIQIFVNPQSRCVKDVLSRYVQSIPLSKQNVLRCKRVIGTHLLAEDNTAKAVEAVAVLTDVVNAQDSTLAKSDFERLDTRHDLAQALMAIEENERAVELLEDVIIHWRLTLCETDRDRLNSERSLALALIKVGKNERAAEVLEEVVRIRRSTLPKTDRSRLASEHSLAVALINLGKNEQAAEILEEVVRIERSTMPETDRSRLTSEYELAAALINLGKNEQAAEILREVVRIERSTLPGTGRSRLASEHSLAVALINLGKNEQAAEILREVVRIRRLTLPKIDRNRLASEHKLAQALINLGKNEQAAEILEEVVRIWKSTLAKTDRSRLASEYYLAVVLINLGKNEQAAEILEEVVRIWKSTLAETDSERLASENLFTVALMRLNDI